MFLYFSALIILTSIVCRLSFHTLFSKYIHDLLIGKKKVKNSLKILSCAALSGMVDNRLFKFGIFSINFVSVKSITWLLVISSCLKIYILVI